MRLLDGKNMINTHEGCESPTCPGTIGTIYRPLTFAEAIRAERPEDMCLAIARAKAEPQIFTGFWHHL